MNSLTSEAAELASAQKRPTTNCANSRTSPLSALFIAIALTSLVSCDGKKVPITEHDRGFNEGVRETREAQNQAGIVGAAVQESKATFGIGKEGKSADYNAGYREGIKAEIEKAAPK